MPDAGGLLSAGTWRLLGEGLVFSFVLTFVSAAGGFLIGIPIALMRLSRSRVLQLFAWTYVNLFRSVPLLLVIFWFYFLVPLLLQAAAGAAYPVPIGPFYSALITFTVFEAAFYSEVIRAGIAGVATGQKEAGEALGLSRMLTFRLIVLPQAIRSMVPAFISQTVVLFQDTSLVYVLTLPDFVGVAGEIGRRDGTLPQMYLIVAAAFFVICFVLSRAAEHLKNR